SPAGVRVSALRRVHATNGTGKTADDPPPAADAPMVEFALDYARRGWPVFPCNPENKRPLTAHGHKDATTDPAQIREWWTAWPGAMIGVPMGARSGVWALDPDPAKKAGEPDGREVLQELIVKNSPLPFTHVEISPRDGWHIIFKWDPQRPVTN